LTFVQYFTELNVSKDMKTILEIYREILLRAEYLKDSKLSGDGYLELYWVAEMLEQTEEVNPSPKYPPQPK